MNTQLTWRDVFWTRTPLTSDLIRGSLSHKFTGWRLDKNLHRPYSSQPTFAIATYGIFMTTESDLHARSASQCELCTAKENLSVYEVPPNSNGSADQSLLLCATCQEQVENPDKMDPHHWRCLNDSMWSPVAAIQVMAWRLLMRLRNEGWPQDLLDMLYLDEETRAWAEATGEGLSEEDKVVHKDSNGAVLTAGDTVTLIKDLDVKGANFTAKRGTAVRNISLVPDNAEQLEGRVNGQQIVILTKFVKKSG